MSARLRVATRADTDAVSALYRTGYGTLLAADYPRDVLDRALPLITQANGDLLASGRFYVVEEADGLKAAGGWSVEAPGTGQVRDGLAHIRHVVTHPTATRRGHARCLVARLTDDARDAGARRMSCISTLTAVAFYAAQGFERMGDREALLAGGIAFPSVEMERSLT